MKFLCLTTLTLLSSTNISIAAEDQNILATYGDNQVVSKEDLLTEFVMMNGGVMPSNYPTYESIPASTKESIVKNIAMGRIVLKEAEKASFTETTQMKRELDKLKRSLMEQSFIRYVVEQNIKKVDLKKVYAEEVKKIQANAVVDYRKIVLTPDKVQEVYAVIDKSGKNFEEMVKKYSIDRDTSINGGLVRNHFVPKKVITPFDDVLANQAVGTVSKPVETTSGWAIYKIEARTVPKAPQFENMKNYLQGKTFEEYKQQYLKDLEATYKLQINTNTIASSSK
ncbi:MAG: peptidylprolyl isomerase [Alphaproteobacteria bacterium]|nr:peptidylprolyl isomerase [Alphaproteobacteria bacterium]OJV13676.1 MAG: hypothetical protein BGO27_00695 [Alphaproteobacteria bacterium 33-17]